MILTFPYRERRRRGPRPRGPEVPGIDGKLEAVGDEIARVVADSQALELLTETLRAAQSSAHTVVPETIVRTARPVSSQPAKGVLFPIERKVWGSTRNRVFLDPRAYTGTERASIRVRCEDGRLFSGA